MPTNKGADKGADSDGSSLAGVLEMLQEQNSAMQEQNRAMQEQHQSQQKMLLDMMEQQRLAHEREMKALKDTQPKEEMGDPAKAKLPKPMLQKLTATDNVEHFLATFERIATQQKWPKEVWATQVAGILSGKAMAAYAALTPEDAIQYKKVKEAILRRYEINEETYRQRFRQDRKKGEESYREYADRLGDHFTRWVDSQAVPLKELVMIEQFLVSVPDDLRIWLHERKPTSIRQAAVLADDYALARKGNQKTNLKTSSSTPPGTGTRLLENSAGNLGSKDRPQSNPMRNGRSQTNLRGDKKCFQCGKFGHLMYSCPDHQRREQTNAGLSGKACDEVAWNKESQKYLRRGMLNGKPVQMLIDTGCTKTMVSADYIHPNCLDIDNQEKILCVHGDMVSYPTAKVNLKLGQWSQVAKVVVAPGIPVPVLLGTDIYELKPVMVTTRAQARRNHSSTAGAQGSSRPEPGDDNEVIPVDSNPQGECSTVSDPIEESNEQRREELPTSTDEEHSPLEANADDIRQWQTTDPTLTRVRDEAGEEESDVRVGFYYHDGLLYRKWRPEGSSEGDVRTCKQLVLPQ